MLYRDYFSGGQMRRQLRLAQKIYSGNVKLGISGLLSNEDYESQRAELLRLATLHRRQRRLRLNPSLSLVFPLAQAPMAEYFGCNRATSVTSTSGGGVTEYGSDQYGR